MSGPARAASALLTRLHHPRVAPAGASVEYEILVVDASIEGTESTTGEIVDFLRGAVVA